MRRVDLLNVRRSSVAACWWCSQPLGEIFTSVNKSGHTLFVHGPCRSPAANFIALDAHIRRATLIEDQPDTFMPRLVVPEVA